jgi:hypothetical protein
MDDAAPSARWAAALRDALAVASATAGDAGDEGAPPDAARDVVALADTYLRACDAALAALAAADADLAAEREAVRSEPPLPPPGTEDRRRMDATHRRILAGLLRGAQAGNEGRLPGCPASGDAGQPAMRK